MVCHSDAFYLHYIMTARDLRRQSRSLGLTKEQRTEILAEALLNLLMALKESTEVENITTRLFHEYFQDLVELTLDGGF